MRIDHFLLTVRDPDATIDVHSRGLGMAAVTGGNPVEISTHAG